MTYGFYPRRSRFRSKGVRTVAITKPKTTYKKYKKNYSKKPAPTFASKVKAIIARDIENKYTSTVTTDLAVCALTNNFTVSPYTSVYSVFTWTPGSSGVGMFNISQGTSIQERIGNKIKLKRWIIKGLIQPNKDFAYAPAEVPALAGITNGILQNSFCGYVTIYFGKYQVNLAPVNGNPLTNFYQSGATDITPEGKQIETLYNINKDLYKIYFRKRFKMGTGLSVSKEPQTYQGTSTVSAPPNVPSITSQSNDFGLTRSFGFDVTKWILKNKTLLYDELVTTPQNPDIENLTLWATFHSAAGDLVGTVPTTISTTINASFYHISAMSYAEYEDA